MFHSARISFTNIYNFILIFLFLFTNEIDFISQERSIKHDLINIYKSNEGKILKLKLFLLNISIFIDY